MYSCLVPAFDSRAPVRSCATHRLHCAIHIDFIMRCCASLFALLLLAAQLTVELTAAAETRSKVDLQAEEERILAQHFPNKDDADADYDEDEELSDNDDDADDENYDDDAHFDANRFGAGGGAAETHPQPPTFLEQPAAAFCTRTQPATLRCSAAHAVQLHIVCSGHQRPPQLVQDEHVDPQSGAHVQQVIATVSAAMVLGHQQAGGGSGGLQTPLRCDCHAVSPGGKARSHPPATVELACKYYTNARLMKLDACARYWYVIEINVPLDERVPTSSRILARAYSMG